MADKGSVAPFVKSFQGKTEITSADFLKIFKKFDKDGEYFVILPITLQSKQFKVLLARPSNSQIFTA